MISRGVLLVGASLLLLLTLTHTTVVVGQQISPFLMVDTPGNEHIVARGILNPAWNATGGGPFILHPQEYPFMRVSIDQSAPVNTMQNYTLTYNSKDPSIVTMTEPTEMGSVTLGGPVVNAISRTICVSTGVGIIEVTMELTFPAATTLVFSFQKQCTLPIIQIGQTPFGSDVVDQTVTVTEFQNWIVLPDTYNLYLYLQNPIPLLIQPFTVLVESTNTADVTIGAYVYNTTYGGGGLGDVAYVLQDPTQPIGMLTIPFVCVNPNTQSIINVTIDYHYPTSLNFSFVKQCGTRPPLTTVTVGTAANLSDIAVGGQLNPVWNTKNNFAPDSIVHYIFPIHLCLGCNTNTPVAPQNWNASFDRSNDVFDIYIEGWPTGWPQGTLTQNVDTPIYADVFCRTNGTSTTNFQIDFGNTYQLIQFSFTYTCVFPFLDMNYQSLNGPVVASSSVVAPGWSGFGQHIPATEAVSTFYLYLDAKNDAQLLPQQYYTIVFSVDSTVQGQPIIADAQYQEAPYIGVAQPINITWTCTSSALASPVTMQVLYGWSTLMSVTMNKNCIADEPDDGPGGWSAAGIFFFTAFILSLILCITGCTWNYFKESKRGLSIIPGYDSATECYDKVRGTDRKWTPQMESTSTRGSTNYGNFDDVGSSYQSNL